MWIRLSSATPFMIKIFCGGVNAVSAEHHSEEPSTKFRRLKLNMDGENIQDYIAAPEHSGLTVLPRSPGAPCFLSSDYVGVVPERQMGIAGGGKIKQTIGQDRHDPRIWEDVTLTIPIQILNSATFHAVTGHNVPPHPIDASTHAEANFPFFGLCEKPSSVAGDFGALKSVIETEQDRV
ncbi:hypothetical protein DL765_011196 [Monosporascus sp. GIB2]|nr:hypothetical protein DL765_011196 [Monosporascus sp. GIB2]